MAKFPYVPTIKLIVAFLLLRGCSSTSSSSASVNNSSTNGGRPSSPTASPLLTAPAPSPRPPRPAVCMGADCCKALASSEDVMGRELCEAFYNPTAGIAFSMLTKGVWQWKAGQYPGLGGAKTPAEANFYEHPPAKYSSRNMEFFSLTNSQKSAHPYGKTSRYGIVYSMSPGTPLWKFFTNKPSTGALCAQCTDGFACPPAFRTFVGNMSWEDFVRAKNDIVEKTATPACRIHNRHSYNEFDLGGLSSTGLVGVFQNDAARNTLGRFLPDDELVCAALRKADPNKKAWPVFSYATLANTSSLRIERYMHCASESTACNNITEEKACTSNTECTWKPGFFYGGTCSYGPRPDYSADSLLIV